MDVPDHVPPGEYVPTADQRVVMYGVPWSHYEVLAALRGEKARPRITYLDGVMELMSPSRTHESVAFYLGRLIEAYALERNITFSGYGSWTLKDAPDQVGVEPDECYLFGDQRRDVPDLVVEVVWTSGGIQKLEVYRRLGVREVWFWQRPNDLSVFLLRDGVYTRSPASFFLPGLDLELVASLLDAPSASEAILALRAALR